MAGQRRDVGQAVPGKVARQYRGAARLVVVPTMDHFFYANESIEASFRGKRPRVFAEGALAAVLDWLRERK